MCNQIDFSAVLKIKVMRDGDGDGRCQEEDGKWVPCPPGIPDGSVVDRLGRAIGKVPLGQTIGEKPAPSPWGPPTGQRVEKPKPRVFRQIRKKRKEKKPPATPRLDPARPRPRWLLTAEHPERYFFDRETPLSADDIFSAIMVTARNLANIGLSDDLRVGHDWQETQRRRRQAAQTIHQEYLAEFEARKAANDPLAISDLPEELRNIKIEDFDNPGWDVFGNPTPPRLADMWAATFASRDPLTEAGWHNKVKYYAEELAEEKRERRDDESLDDYGYEIKKIAEKIAALTYAEYIAEFKRRKSLAFDSDTPLTYGDWMRQVVGIPEYDEAKPYNALFENSLRTMYEAYLESHANHADLKEILDEDGNIKPEYVDEYLTKHRAAQEAKAEKVRKNAENQIDPENLRAARRINLDDYTLSEDAIEEEVTELWDYENDEPRREDYLDSENDDENEQAFQDAHDEWETRREYEIRDLISSRLDELASEWDDVARRAFGHTFTGLDGETYTVQVTGTSQDSYDGTVSFSAKVINSRGDRVGGLQRTINLHGPNGPYVYHDHFRVERNYRKAGIASTVNALNEQIYQALGVYEIRVTGASSPGDYIGASHWPKNGFTWADGTPDPNFIDSIKRAIRTAPNTHWGDAKTREIIKELVEAVEQGDYTIEPGDLLNWPGAEEWFQQDHLSIGYQRNL